MELAKVLSIPLTMFIHLSELNNAHIDEEKEYMLLCKCNGKSNI